jgi:hypothetical protein
MFRTVLVASAAFAFAMVCCAATSFRSPDSDLSEDHVSSPSQTSGSKAAQTEAQDSSASEHKKPKKVWTNESLADVSGSAISQVGNASQASPSKPPGAKPVSAQVVADYRKQLGALEAQLADIDKQISSLKDFNRGEAGKDVGLQLHKKYNLERTDDQIRKLEEKRKQVAAQMDSVFDAARKAGIEPGQLR